MKYTEKDLYKGMKLRCVSTIEPLWWNVGKEYNVEKRTDGLFILKDETGYIWNSWLILEFLNGKAHCKMEIVEEEEEMKYTENDIKVGTKLHCTKSIPERWTVGKLYDITLNEDYNSLQILDDEGYWAFTDYILDCLNGNRSQVSFEIIEEEKEMKKYAKITKYAGLIDTDKENGLEIGKEYEIVKFSSVSEDCWVYLNDKRPEYFISEIQYELVEKEYPVAEIKVGILAKLEAKIEKLREEEYNLFEKTNRIKKQEQALHDKRMRLIEAKEAFEFLKHKKIL